MQLKRISRMSLNLLRKGWHAYSAPDTALLRCCEAKLIVYRIPCDFVFPPATSWMETPRPVLGERVPVPAKTRGQHTQVQRVTEGGPGIFPLELKPAGTCSALDVGFPDTAVMSRS